jgi:hypothetical protein
LHAPDVVHSIVKNFFIAVRVSFKLDKSGLQIRCASLLERLYRE